MAELLRGGAESSGRGPFLARGLAAALVWSRFLLVAFWLAVVAFALTAAPARPAGDGGVNGLVSTSSPTVATERASAQAFGFPLLARTAIVQRDPAGLPLQVQARAAERAAALGQGERPDLQPVFGILPVPNTRGLFPGAEQSDNTIVTYVFMPPWMGFAEQVAATERLIQQTYGPADSVVGVTGSVPARVQQKLIVEEYLPRIEMFTVAAIILIVGLTFRSVVAPLVTVAIGGIALILTTRVATLLAGWLGVQVPGELQPLYVALVLGVVTDYVVFYLASLRRRLQAGEDRLTAARSATTSVTPIVLAAGLTVAAGTLALLVARSPLFRAFGPGMALAVVVGLVVSMTLVPAVMALLGRWMFWPVVPKPAPVGTASQPAAADATGGGIAAGMIRRLRLSPWRMLTRPRPAALVLAACVVGLTLAALPLLQLRLGVAFVPSLPPGNNVFVAAQAAKAGFADGILSPTTVLAQAPGITERRDALARFGDLLRNQPGVAGVVGPGLQPLAQEQGIVLSRDRGAARYLLVLDQDPLGAFAIQDVAALREKLPELAAAAGLGGVNLGLGGDTSLGQELVESTSADLGRIALVALAANLLMLVLFLRALVAPLYLLACSVLALLATLGLTTLVFQTFLGADGLTFYVPFAAAVLLVALGSDYNIFGVGSVWEEARHYPLRQAIRRAMPASTRAITSAAVTLAVSFGLLAVVPLRPFRELAFALGVGILLDAFVVRTLLVPALLTLVGPVSAWPGRLMVGGPPPPDGEVASATSARSAVPTPSPPDSS